LTSPDRRRFLIAAAALVAAAPATVDTAADAVLSIDANGDVRGLTMEDLRALPRTMITTTTEFTDGPTQFAGPLARDVLTPPDGATVAVMRAINDYSVEIPLDDFRRFDVVLAIEVNGKTMSRRDKGPIWVMYPLDDHPELQSPIYINRLIWQLSSVAFK
jgi:hypothetical protein